MSSEHYAAITFVCVLAFWAFSMITLNLFFDDVFYEEDVSKGEGWIKPKNSTNVVVFMRALAPFTLVVLVIKTLLVRIKRYTLV